MPDPPSGLADAGKAAWTRIWSLHWIVPQRHWQTVQRYCEMTDVLAASLAQVRVDGYMIEGSHGRMRAHHALTEIRHLATELRRTESELGITPASESKAGVEPYLDEVERDRQIARRKNPGVGLQDDDVEDYDPRLSCKLAAAPEPKGA
ncbi:hypothetical protein MAHJHV55_06330 [Mycobacterium avium subsp. hominissuis]